MGQEPRKRLEEVLQKTRNKLRHAIVLEGLVVSVTGITLLLTVSVGALAIGLSDTTTGWAQLLLGLVLLTFLALRYGHLLVSGLTKPERIATWLDRIASKDDSQIRILSAVEMLRDGDTYGESRSLSQHAVEQALDRVSSLEVNRLVRQEAWQSLRRWLLPCSIFLFAFFIILLSVPRLVSQATVAIGSLSSLSDGDRLPPEPRLSDIRLTYRYPAYSERPVRTETAPDGHIYALPGTEVEIETNSRTAIQNATLLVSHGSNRDEASAEPRRIAVAVDGRHLRSTLVISKTGRYRFRLKTSDGDLLEERKGHEIELEVDAPPEISLLQPEKSPLEVNERDRITLMFEASDDFALGDIFVAWRVLKTTREGRVRLTSAASGLRRFDGTAQLDLSSLKLRPGDHVAYTLEATDNDTVNGPKVGSSDTQELRIYSKKAHHERVLALQEKALDELVHLLGDNLEALFEHKLSIDAYKALLKAGDAMVKRARETNDLLIKTVAAVRKDPLGRPQVAEAFEQARVDLRRDERRERRSLRTVTRVLSRSTKLDRQTSRSMRKTQDQMVSSLERNVVYLADLLNDQRMIDAEELVKELRAQQQALKDALEQYKNAPSEEKRKEIALAIEAIRQRIMDISKQLSKTSRSIPQDFVNKDALQANDAQAQMDQLQRMLESGDLDSAMDALEKMLSRTEKMMAELQSGRQEIKSREYSEVAEMAQKLWNDLEALERDERSLANETETLSKKVLERMRSRIGDAESFAEKQIKRLKAALKGMEHVRPDKHMPNAERFDRTERRLKDGIRALEPQPDFGAAREVLEEAASQLASLEQEARRSAENARRYGDFFGLGPHAERTERELRRVRPIVDEVLKDIEQLMPSPETLLSETERGQVNEFAQRQQQLRGRAEKLDSDLKQLGQKLPIVGPESQKMVSEAGQAMGQAEGSLKGGDTPGALSQERRALDALQQLKNELEQMANKPGSQNGGGVPLPFGQPRGSSGYGPEGSQNLRTEDVEIPKPEQFKPPAEFREDILEAAKQGTVESYREAVRRYYEELVK